MKSKSTGSGDKKGGFYTALAAGAGAILVLTLVISFSNLTLSSPDPQLYSEFAEEEAVMAGYSHTIPYMVQADLDQALFRPRQQPAPSPEPSEPPAPRITPPVREPTPSPAPVPEPASEPSQEQTEVTPAATEPPPAEPPAQEPPGGTAQEQAVFEPFTEANQLIWPVYGDIAMTFSQDRLIYNPTLDQWRTNDDLRISAQEGTPVRAAAAGKVSEIGSDRVYGNFVRIYNGNGWETIYGQLMDGILVTEGDIVQTGQVIGGVGRPSVFSVLNGHHVSLRVLHEEALVDPKLLLAEIAE